MKDTNIQMQSIDHIVLAVADPEETSAFYHDVLGLQPIQDADARWSLAFGQNKINLQPQDALPPIARQTTRGSANFCIITDTPIRAVMEHLKSRDIKILAGPMRKEGGIGPLMSIYFYDIDGNLVEVSNNLTADEKQGSILSD